MVEVRVKEGGESLARVNRDVANVFVISIELKPMTKSVEYGRFLPIRQCMFLCMAKSTKHDSPAIAIYIFM